jgi:hypothetical protein
MAEDFTNKESSSSKYSEEKKFIREEESKNTLLFRTKLKNKFFAGIIFVMVIGWGFSILLNLFILDRLKKYDIKFAQATSYAYNSSQQTTRQNKKEELIQEICRIALFYNPKYNEARLYKVAETIYDVGFIKYGISVDECILLFTLESEWRKNAVSKAGAKGLGQLMVPTARWACASIGISYEGDDTLFNDVLNVKLSLYVYNQYRGYFDDKLVWYLTAYNFGETTIRQLYSLDKPLTGNYLNYYKSWLEKREVVERVLGRKLNIKDK